MGFFHFSVNLNIIEYFWVSQKLGVNLGVNFNAFLYDYQEDRNFRPRVQTQKSKYGQNRSYAYYDTRVTSLLFKQN